MFCSWNSPSMRRSICVSLYTCIIVFVYLCICVFVSSWSGARRRRSTLKRLGGTSSMRTVRARDLFRFLTRQCWWWYDDDTYSFVDYFFKLNHCQLVCSAKNTTDQGEDGLGVFSCWFAGECWVHECPREQGGHWSGQRLTSPPQLLFDIILIIGGLLSPHLQILLK